MDKKLEKIFAYRFWRQSIDLGNGFKTPGHIQSGIWDFVGLPKSLKGKTFLDIGSNDGLFSFEAEKRGAKEVVACDLYKQGIDSMINGWDKDGIEMIKEYLGSDIKINEKGIYSLEEMNKKFDVVFVNDIINWLADIEEAIRNLSTVANGELYISDGFLVDNSEPKQVSYDTGSVRYMYNLSFIFNLLKKYGFKVVSTTELNFQIIFIRDYIELPFISLGENTKAYQLPDKSSSFEMMGKRTERCNAIHGDFFHIFNIGWVHKDEVEVIYNKPSVYYTIAKKLNLLGVYFQFLKVRHKSKTGMTAYSIKAVKI